jgi:hypothetical protein
MSKELVHYFREHINQPLAWSVGFGVCGVAAGAFAGLIQGGIGSALLGAFVCGVVGGVTGLVSWVVAQLVRLTVWLMLAPERPVGRPDLWAHPLRCPHCGWRTTPEGPWRRLDCMFPPQSCPSCGSGRLASVRPPCPRCGTVFDRPFRWPTSLRQALWGGWTCRECGLDYDKWGRQVIVPPGDMPDPPAASEGARSDP